MRFLLIPGGTQGDARPMAAFGMRLITKGHKVIVCSSPEHKDFFNKYGMEFYPIGLNLKERIKEDPALLTGNDIKHLFSQVKYFRDDFPTQINDILNTVKETDCIIDGGVSVAGRTIAEYFKVPYRHLVVIPGLLRSDKRIPFQHSNKKRSKLAVKMYWAYADFIFGLPTKGTINKVRKKIGLKPIKSLMDYYTNDAILATDEEIGKVDSSVKTRHMQVGYFHLDDEGELDKDLLDFIEAGSKPIYIGFGSMPDREPEKLNQIFNEILGCKDYRFIISKGWSNMLDNAKGENIKVVDYVPHSKLFPKMAAIIHHGGAGTVHTAAMSGVPQIIVGYLAEHLYWGVKLHDLKMGAKHISRTQLTAENLLAAIRETMQTPAYKENAERMGKILTKKHSESDFVDRIIEWIKQDS